MHPFSPQQIVGGFNRKDPRVNRRIFDFYYPIVTRKIREKIGDCPELPDLVSMVMTKLWAHREPFRVFKEMRDHIHIATFHVCSDYLKQRQTRQSRTESIAEYYENVPAYDPGHLEADAYLLDLIYREVENLSPKTREVFLMHHKGQLSTDTIARQLGMAEKTVQNHLSLAIKTLKTRLERKGSVMRPAIILSLVKLLYEQL